MEEHYTDALNTAETWSQKAIDYAPSFAIALLTLIIGFWLSGKVAGLIGNAMRKRNIDESIIPFITSIVSVIIKVLVVISVAEKFGIKTTSFIAILGGAGLAIGLALQGTLGHFSSGVMLMIFKPYKVGDLVKIGDFTGTVKEIQVFETVLLTFENQRIHIPNGTVTSGPITNISGEGVVRADMTFSVDSANSFDAVRNAIKDVADRSSLILKTPVIQVNFRTDDMDKHVVDVWPWCNAADYFDAFYYLQEEVRKEFDKRGIKGNVPDMNVNVKQA